MRRFVMIFATLLLVAPAFAQEVVELPQPESNKIIVRLQFRAGSICDPQGMEGLTYLTAQWVADGGTTELTKSEIDDYIYPMAAGYGVSVDKEAVNFTFQFPTDFTAEFYPILRELMLNPRFDENDFNRVKSRQLNYVTRSVKNSSDEDYSKMVLEHFLFEGKNYSHMVQGNEAGVNAITPEAAKALWEQYFTKDNVRIGIAGNYNEAFKNQLVEDLQQLPGLEGELPTGEKAEMPSGIEVKIVSKPGAFGSAIYMGYPLEIDRSSDDFAALMVANSWLGEHRKSYGKLYQKIREIRSMNYGDYSYIEWYPAGSSNQLPLSGYPRNANYASLWIRPVQLASGLREQYEELSDTEVGHAMFAIRMALRTKQMMIENGLSEEDFEQTRKFLRSYINLYVKSPMQRLGYLMDSRFYGHTDWINEVDAQLAELTVEEVNAAVKQYMQTENLMIAIITSPEEASVLARYFMEDIASPMSYSNVVKEGLNDAVYEEDAQVEGYSVKAASVEIIDTKELFVD